jgi:hypothetical protein
MHLVQSLIRGYSDLTHNMADARDARTHRSPYTLNRSLSDVFILISFFIWVPVYCIEL